MIVMVMMLVLMVMPMSEVMTMTVSMGSMTEASPDQKDDPGKNQHSTDDAALLGINLMLNMVVLS